MSSTAWLVALIFISSYQVCYGRCSSDEYLCRNGRCVKRLYVCDGDDDCHDRSDEDICGVDRNRDKVLFECRNPQYIAKNRVCDGSPDCDDGSDEENCGTDIFFREANSARVGGISWLKSKRNNLWGWDENTHRGVAALYLAGGATFDGTNEEQELMAKQLELEMALTLLRNETVPVNPNQMALYVNAMLVTCHNPRNFYGFNLIHLLKQMIQFKQNSTHPIVYLALCNANETVSTDDVKYLLAILNHESEYLFWTDIQAMAVIALSCITSQGQYAHLAPNITKTVKSFKDQQRTDGSFGTVYTTALVVQALLATANEMEKNWDLEGAIKYLKSKQSASDGSFGDFLATYLILPILNRRSLADIAHVKCTNLRRQPRDRNSMISSRNHLGPSVYVTYSLYFGDDMKVIHPILLKVPSNTTVYDVMNLAVEADPKYRYEFKRTSNGLYIYSIAGTANDPETGMFWLMHLGNVNGTEATLETESPDKIFVKGGEHLIMWYRTANIQPQIMQ